MKKQDSIHNIRREFQKAELHLKDMEVDPYMQFCKWFEEMLTDEHEDPTSFVLTTATLSGKPSSRVVLLKGHSPEGFIFFTNYLSRKGKEIEQNPYVSMLFYRPAIERQIRIEGIAEKISEQESDEYFRSRPRDSRISALLSRQSSPADDEQSLKETFDYSMKTMCDDDIQRPKHWGGYLIRAHAYEFWQGRPGRLHDRFLYEKRENNQWFLTRLQP
jgi:pyridoxamine 5'-phosphate oxidase